MRPQMIFLALLVLVLGCAPQERSTETTAADDGGAPVSTELSPETPTEDEPGHEQAPELVLVTHKGEPFTVIELGPDQRLSAIADSSLVEEFGDGLQVLDLEESLELFEPGQIYWSNEWLERFEVPDIVPVELVARLDEFGLRELDLQRNQDGAVVFAESQQPIDGVRNSFRQEVEDHFEESRELWGLINAPEIRQCQLDVLVNYFPDEVVEAFDRPSNFVGQFDLESSIPDSEQDEHEFVSSLFGCFGDADAWYEIRMRPFYQPEVVDCASGLSLDSLAEMNDRTFRAEILEPCAHAYQADFAGQSILLPEIESTLRDRVGG